ncbi:fatty acid desaturase [Streptomyces erythrochromogenes]|uniref:fatty acid desaturase n=1 Tax=Streptomyces erythrochromogenes TaxID=285574 RepID=UPI00368C1F85
MAPDRRVLAARRTQPAGRSSGCGQCRGAVSPSPGGEPPRSARCAGPHPPCQPAAGRGRYALASRTGPVSVRRRRHVRDHHPNATLATDPNLAELAAAGLRPGIQRRAFAIALLHPLTPRGIRATTVGLADTLRLHPARWAGLAAVFAAAYLTGNWTAVLAGVLVPRLVLYPLLAWWSLLVEHTWWDPEHRTGTPAEVEAGRCMRLYPRSRVLAALAAATWLPYGDLHHYAHSAHPGLRWNYLPALERHLPDPHFTPTALFAGQTSVVQRHRTALT